jgi:hypothetical protein
MDITKPEDIDTKMEDHIYDEACHICMARPHGITVKPVQVSEVDRRIDALEKGSKDRGGYVATAEREADITEDAMYDHFATEDGDDYFETM